MFVAALVVPARAAHSRGMRLRQLVVLLAALGLGCSSNMSADMSSGAPRPPSESFWGGQTGSLTPKCGSVAEVPEGATGIVVDTRGCAGTPTDADVRLTSESGEIIESDWIPLGGGRYLVRPSQSLETGQYQVSIAGASQGLAVGASSPKPTLLGKFEQVAASCYLSVTLRLDSAVLPYATLLRVEAVLDGTEHVLAEFGALTATNTTLPISCTDCLSSGSHLLQAYGEIAGEPGMLVTEPLEVESSCTRAYYPADSGSDSGSGCGFARAPSSGAGGIWGGIALGLLALLGRARAKKSGGS
jgi:hypothetical protein